MLDSVAAGKYPAPDGGITIMEQAPARYAGVIGFTAHAVIFVDADPAWVSKKISSRERSERPGIPRGRLHASGRGGFVRRRPLGVPAAGLSAAPGLAEAVSGIMAGVSDSSQVTDNEAASRFELTADGGLGELVYRLRDGRLVILHSEVPEALGGRGLGGQLVSAAVDRAARG